MVENACVVSRLRTLVGKRQRGSQCSGRARSTTLASLCTRNSDPRKAQRNKCMNQLQEEVARQDPPLGASVSVVPTCPSDPLTLCSSPALTRLACLCCPGFFLTNTQLDSVATLWSRAVWLAVGTGRAKGVRDELSTPLWLGSPATDPIMAGFS